MGSSSEITHEQLLKLVTNLKKMDDEQGAILVFEWGWKYEIEGFKKIDHKLGTADECVAFLKGVAEEHPDGSGHYLNKIRTKEEGNNIVTEAELHLTWRNKIVYCLNVTVKMVDKSFFYEFFLKEPRV